MSIKSLPSLYIRAITIRRKGRNGKKEGIMSQERERERERKKEEELVPRD
jgi:hypothetical protein